MVAKQRKLFPAPILDEKLLSQYLEDKGFQVNHVKTVQKVICRVESDKYNLAPSSNRRRKRERKHHRHVQLPGGATAAAAAETDGASGDGDGQNGEGARQQGGGGSPREAAAKREPGEGGENGVGEPVASSQSSGSGEGAAGGEGLPRGWKHAERIVMPASSLQLMPQRLWKTLQVSPCKD